MKKQIINFHKSMRVPNISTNEIDAEPPVTYTHIFHKEYPRLGKIRIKSNETHNNLTKILRKRNSIRNFENTSIDEVAEVLGTSFDILEKNGNSFERRTYPSGGARFPIEVYLLSFNLLGLQNGVYHYKIMNHTLEVLLKRDIHEHHDDVVSPFIENAPCALVLTTVLSRSEVKYSNRSYLYSAIECGHIGQNIYLACAELGLGCCGIGGFKDKTLINLIDLVDDELPMYVIAVGKPRK